MAQKNKFRSVSKPQFQALLEVCARAGIDADEEFPLTEDTMIRLVRSGKLLLRVVRTKKPQQPERFFYDIASSEDGRPRGL